MTKLLEDLADPNFVTSAKAESPQGYEKISAHNNHKAVLNNTSFIMQGKPPVSRLALLILTCTLCIVWLVIILRVSNPAQLFFDYWHFFFLGITGAIAANSTGAGGGIVFIPAFTSLGVNDTTALGTSLAIQCFGMTAGSISWLYSIYNKQHGGKQVIALTHRLLLLSGISAIAGMLFGQYIAIKPPFSITSLFKYFSITFGCILLFVTLKPNPHRHTRYHVRHIDIPLIIFTCFAGGIVTSWISVGAGEWIALLLFFLGYPTMVSVCIAVCVSSMVVLSGIPYHLLITKSISLEILLFAAPAALIGGVVARFLAERLGPVRLKVFFAAWILATGFAMG